MPSTIPGSTVNCFSLHRLDLFDDFLLCLLTHRREAWVLLWSPSPALNTELLTQPSCGTDHLLASATHHIQLLILSSFTSPFFSPACLLTTSPHQLAKCPSLRTARSTFLATKSPAPSWVPPTLGPGIPVPHDLAILLTNLNPLEASLWIMFPSNGAYHFCVHPGFLLPPFLSLICNPLTPYACVHYWSTL